MSRPTDLSRSLAVLKGDSTLIAVIEMSLTKWLVAGIVPGVERQPLKKLDADGCIMVRVLEPTGYKVVARLIRARKRAPLR